MRPPKKEPFSKSRKCSKFKVTNWSQYNNILRNRGHIDLMIAEDLSDGGMKIMSAIGSVEAREDIADCSHSYTGQYLKNYLQPR